MLPIKYTLWAKVNVIFRFTRGYEVVAADILDGNIDLGESQNLQLESKYNRYFYTVDEQGSTAFIIDENQKVRNEYYYDAFGNVLDSKEEIHNRITYTGQQFDGITQQYYLRARFYNPVIGRFTQEDVYRGDGLNLYAYCGNNPVRYYDPSGYAKKSKKTISDMSYDEIVSELNQYYKEHVEKKDDDLTGHHMPSQQFMGDKCKVEFDDAYSLNLEQIFPGVGGRHRRTFTYGVKGTSRKYQLYSKLTPRDALAFDMYDVRRILKEDGLYNKETRKTLKDYINDYKNSSNSKDVFNKDNKLNKESSRVKQCKKK